MYRDGENYKQYNEVVIGGEFTLDQLRPHLYEGESFMPSEVGLEDLQEYPYRNCDHIWHQLVSAEPTKDAPTVEMGAEALVVCFRKAGEVNWETPLVNERMMEMA
jgi:hypothetical protein